MAWTEESDMTKMLHLTKEENIKKRCEAAVNADGIIMKRCKQCQNLYGYPTKNPWAQSKLGPDNGMCPECNGVYDDPEQFLEF